MKNIEHSINFDIINHKDFKANYGKLKEPIKAYKYYKKKENLNFKERI